MSGGEFQNFKHLSRAIDSTWVAGDRGRTHGFVCNTLEVFAPDLYGA
jgi:hypothetical protein